MILCSQKVTTQVRAFLRDYGVGGGIFILVFCLVIPGFHIFIIVLPLLLLVSSGGIIYPTLVTPSTNKPPTLPPNPSPSISTSITILPDILVGLSIDLDSSSVPW